jgi:hypothetical protein
VKSTRPASDGTFGFTDLPAGDYRLVALTDLEPDVWNSAKFLDTIAGEGVAIRVDEAQHVRQDLRVAQP